MNWSVFGKAFLVETVYSIPFLFYRFCHLKSNFDFRLKS